MFDKPRPTSRSARTRLQLLAPPARPPHAAYVPPRRLPRRPGERREPLAADLAPALITAAAECGLDPRCAAELCLERALVLADLAAAPRPGLYGQLLALAATATISQSLPPPTARYLQMLLAVRDRQSATAVDVAAASAATTADADDIVLDVPLRLFPRATGVAAEALATADAGQLDEALVLEIAAVGAGRTMSEWAALAALRLSL